MTIYQVRDTTGHVVSEYTEMRLALIDVQTRNQLYHKEAFSIVELTQHVA